jgi:hypothetical protein
MRTNLTAATFGSVRVKVYSPWKKSQIEKPEKPIF